jgi:DNA-binding PadR family transcriptional regulator
MIDRSFEPSVTFALDILLDQLDPHREPRDTALGSDRQLCGQWLAFCRMQRPLTMPMITQRTQLAPHQLTLLEAGLGEPTLFPDYALHALSLVLEDAQHDFAWVRAVINGAAGVAAVPTPALMRISAELHANLTEAALTLPLDDPPIAAASDTTLDLHLRPEVYTVLVALEHGAATGLAIKENIAAREQGRSTIGLATIHAILSYLLKNQMAEAHEPVAETGADQQQIYRLTADGRVIAREVMRLQEAEQRVHEKQEEAEQEQRIYEKQRAQLEQQLPWSLRSSAPTLP